MNLPRRRRSAKTATVAAMNPRVAIWGTGAELFSGIVGAHFSAGEHIRNGDLSGAVCTTGACRETTESADSIDVANVNAAPRRQVVATRKSSHRWIVCTGIHSTGAIPCCSPGD
jgi:hypothetical protein